MANPVFDALGDAARAVLGTVAPALATAVGGPLAGAAVGALSRALGLAPDASAADVGKIIANATPDQLLAMRKADQDFQVQMRQLDLDVTKLGFDDIANARQMQTQAIQADSATAWMPWLFAAAIVGVWVAVQCGLVPPLGDVASARVDSTAQMVLAFVFGMHRAAGMDTLLYNSTPATK